MGTIWADSECGATHRDCQSREHQWLVHWGQKEDCTNFYLQGEEFGARQVNPSVCTLLFSLPIFLVLPKVIWLVFFPFFVYILLPTEASFHSPVLNWVTKLPLCPGRTDPVRPFISGHVANSMAAEVIALLHSLLMAPESNAAQIWTTTAEKVSKHNLEWHMPHWGLSS